MTEFLPGGRRRIDRVLAPQFLHGLAEASLDEVRRRRAEANQEEVDLSFARRLVQGRLDLLHAEHERRRGVGPLVGAPHTDEALAEALKQILAEDERVSHGLSRHLAVEPSRVGEHRREAERAVADVTASDLAAMSDAELAEAISYLQDVEARISRSRRQVQAVVDALTEEVARRYQTGAVSVVDAGERLNHEVGLEPA